MKNFLSLMICFLLIFTLCACDFDKKTDTKNNISTVKKTDSKADKDNNISNNNNPKTDDSAYKAVYTDYVKNVDLDDYNQFALIYVDDDNIPELYVMGTCEASGEIICTYYEGALTEQFFGRLEGTDYVEKGGLILHSNGHMGHYYTNLFALEKGVFTQLHESTTDELYNDKTGEYYYEYTVNGVECDTETYENTVFSWTAGLPLTSTAHKIMSYDEIIEMLK